MSEPLTPERARVPGGEPHPDSEVRGESGLMDGIRFLYRRRVRLAVWFIVFVGSGIIALLVSYLLSPTIVQGVLGLAFSGIERHEYPSGKKFTVEAFRSPDVLTRALSDAGIPQERVSLREVSAGIFVTPIIPGDVQARWMKQEKDGVRKDEYFPSEFRIALHVDGLGNAQQLRLFDAIVKSYQDRVKYEQKAALSFVAGGWDASFDKLAARYDFWDIPMLFAETYKSLGRELEGLITEAVRYQDAKYHLGFRAIARELHNWQMTRLNALEALTYQGRLVKNRDLTIQRVQHRLEDIDIQIKQKVHEASEGLRLLGVIDRPNALVAGRLAIDKGLPVVDVGAIEKLLRNDYVAPVVTKISRLQSETYELEAERGRLQKNLAWLPKAVNIDLKQLPGVYRDVIEILSSELDGIAQSYNRLLDEYLTATVTSLVAIKQSPMSMREGYSPRKLVLVVIGIMVLSVFLAIFMMSVGHLWRTVREQG